MLLSKAQLNNNIKCYLLGDNVYKLNNQAMLDEKDIAKRLRQVMDAVGISNSGLADRMSASGANTSLQALSGWLKTGKIARDRLPYIRRALGVSIDWLLTGEGPMMLQDTESRLTPHQRSALNLFESLTDSQQEDMIECMTEAKQQNEKIYLELKRKYESQPLKTNETTTPTLDRRSGQDRRQDNKTVPVDFRSGLDRREDKATRISAESVYTYVKKKKTRKDVDDSGR